MHQTLCDLEVVESGIMRGTSVGMVVCEIGISGGIGVCDTEFEICVKFIDRKKCSISLFSEVLMALLRMGNQPGMTSRWISGL